MLGSEDIGLGSIPTAAGTDSPGVTPSGGGTLLFAGINTGTTELAAEPSADYDEGQLAWVQSVGAYFELRSSALTVDGITTVAASGKTGFQWLRLFLPNAVWTAQAAWFVDPVSGSDEAAGNTNAAALQTLQELKRRWWGAEIKANATVTILGNLPSTDSGSWNFTVKPNVFVTFIGSIGATTGAGGRSVNNTLYSGTVTGFVAASATMANDDIELTDSAIPVSFTASGLLAAGVIFKRTNSTARYWYALKDLGSKTIRINPPMNNGGVQFSSALTVGDGYSAFQLWTIYDQDFGGAARSVTLDLLDYEGTFGAVDPGYAYSRKRNWIGGSGFQIIVIGTGCTNCMFAMPNASVLTTSSPEIPVQIIGGAARGTGATQISLFGSLGIGIGFADQGCVWAPNDGGYLSIEGTIGVYDTTAAVFSPVATARVSFGPNQVGAGVSGKGNTSKLVSVQWAGQFAYVFSSATPPFLATTTTDPNPILILGVSYPVSALPANANTVITGGLIFPSAFTSMAATPGGATVAMTNAPAGSPAAPVRYVQIPDNAGGFFTVPSLT